MGVEKRIFHTFAEITIMSHGSTHHRPGQILGGVYIAPPVLLTSIIVTLIIHSYLGNVKFGAFISLVKNKIFKEFSYYMEVSKSSKKSSM